MVLMKHPLHRQRHSAAVLAQPLPGRQVHVLRLRGGLQHHDHGTGNYHGGM